MPTIAQAITEGARLLQASGIDQERRTAGLLLCHVMRIDRIHLLTRSEDQIDDAQYRSYIEHVERRASGEPLQYITGHQEFYGLDFIVTPDVLIPRPETEFLVERVVKLVDEYRLETPLIVDLGTGSGCVAVALAINLPGARVIATDTSQAALDVARANAECHGVPDRIEFLEGDLLSPLLEEQLEGTVDVLASNPPYVNAKSSKQIQREVREWEPHTALFGGADGLDVHRRLLVDAPRCLQPRGYLVFEIGYGQLGPIRELIAGSAFELVDVTHDLQKLPRILTLRQATVFR